MRVALHTRVRADRIEAYEQAHREVPAELAEEIRAAGCRSWTIWRSGTDLFHVIDCEDYPRLIAHMDALEVNRVWQQRMGELLEVVHDYGSDGADAVLPVVWQL